MEFNKIGYDYFLQRYPLMYQVDKRNKVMQQDFADYSGLKKFLEGECSLNIQFVKKLSNFRAFIEP